MTKEYNHCEQCERFDNDCIKSQRCPKNPDLVFCDDCGAGIDLDDLDSSDVLSSTEHEQFWGAPCSYEIAIGFVCPCCRATNMF